MDMHNFIPVYLLHLYKEYNRLRKFSICILLNIPQLSKPFYLYYFVHCAAAKGRLSMKRIVAYISL